MVWFSVVCGVSSCLFFINITFSKFLTIPSSLAVSDLLASLGHTLNTQTLTKTDEQKKKKGFNEAYDFVLGCIQNHPGLHAACGMDTPKSPCLPGLLSPSPSLLYSSMGLCPRSAMSLWGLRISVHWTGHIIPWYLYHLLFYLFLFFCWSTISGNFLRKTMSPCLMYLPSHLVQNSEPFPLRTIKALFLCLLESRVTKQFDVTTVCFWRFLLSRSFKDLCGLSVHTFSQHLFHVCYLALEALTNCSQVFPPGKLHRVITD